MNILHLNTHLNAGGITSYLETLGRSLTKKGHRVAVISGGGIKVPALERHGIRCYTLPIRTKSEVHPKIFRAVPEVSRIAREGKFDLLHAHTRVTEVLAAMVSKKTGIPFVTTAHGFYKRRLGRKLFPCWGERVLAVSPMVAEELEKTHEVPASRIRVVNNAVDLEDLEKRLRSHEPAEMRAQYGIPQKAFVVGNIARLVSDKGQEYLIRSMPLLMKEVADPYLLLVGDGAEKSRLEALIASLGLRERVRLMEGVQDTIKVLSAMDIFVHPATWREGFGLAIAEALVAGKPVILSRIPALDTLFKDGVDALLVPPKDPQALNRAMVALHRDTGRAKTLAEAGRDKVAEFYRAERQADEIEGIYKEVLDGKGKKA